VYVCLCRAVSSTVICAAIEDGASSVDEVADRSAAGTVCGKCRQTIEKLLAEHAGATGGAN
jgi:bacterioferritin-associated ferredoxin